MPRDEGFADIAVKLRERDRSEQVSEGRCNIVPLPPVATRPFRSELTVEQNTIFVSNQYRGDAYTFEHQISHPDSGEPVIRRITVGRENATDRGRGVLTQIHQDVFYAVLRLWAEGTPHYQFIGGATGESYGKIHETRYKVVTAIRGAGNDRAEDYRRVQQLLRDLASTPVTLENVYTWQGFKERETFTLLSEVRWRERASAAGDEEARVVILLSSFVTEGFLHKNIKILLGQPYDELRSEEAPAAPGQRRRGSQLEIARLLYPFLDSQLAKKDEYSARLDGLCERFGLGKYVYKSERKRKFDRSLQALDGKLIQKGEYVLRITLRESKDGDDFVMCARRERAGNDQQLGLFDQ